MWKYTGYMVDRGTPTETCELCGMTNLRYHFEIREDLDTKMVGSECIKKFGYEGWERAIADRGRAIRHRRPLQNTTQVAEARRDYRPPRDMWDDIQDEEWEQPEVADDPEDNTLIMLAREKS